MKNYPWLIFWMLSLLVLGACKNSNDQTVPDEKIDFIPGVVIEEENNSDPEGWKSLTINSSFRTGGKIDW